MNYLILSMIFLGIFVFYLTRFISIKFKNTLFTSWILILLNFVLGSYMLFHYIVDMGQGTSPIFLASFIISIHVTVEYFLAAVNFELGKRSKK